MKMLIYIYCYIVILLYMLLSIIMLLYCYMLSFITYSGDFQEMGFQIGSNENGWSKILRLRTYKALTLRKQKTLLRYANRRRLKIAVERTCLSLSRYLCLADPHPLHMVDLRYVFNLLSVLNERSHSAGVVGNAHKMRILVWMLLKHVKTWLISSTDHWRDKTVFDLKQRCF